MPSDPFVDFAALSSLGPVQYLDARNRAAFDAGHVPSALHVPVAEWDKAKAADLGFTNTAYRDDASLAVGANVAATIAAFGMLVTINGRLGEIGEQLGQIAHLLR